MSTDFQSGAIRPRVLIIEDEPSFAQAVSYYLEREGFDPTVAHDGEEGLRKALLLLPDVIVLDLMLPGKDGLEVCRELRANDRTRHLPIIMLTAKTEESDQLIGFSVGADDYVTKPCSMKVFVQRVKALQRRTAAGPPPSDVIEHLGVRIDRTRYKVTFNGSELQLTPTEFRLLDCLVRQPGRTFSRQQLIEAGIGPEAGVLERTIDIHIKTLRRKLGDASLIETVHGVGYRFPERLRP